MFEFLLEEENGCDSLLFFDNSHSKVSVLQQQ